MLGLSSEALAEDGPWAEARVLRDRAMDRVKAKRRMGFMGGSLGREWGICQRRFGERWLGDSTGFPPVSNPLWLMETRIQQLNFPVYGPPESSSLQIQCVQDSRDELLAGYLGHLKHLELSIPMT